MGGSLKGEGTGDGSPLCGRGPEACRTGRRQSSSDEVSWERGDTCEELLQREKRGRPCTPHPPLKDNDRLIIPYYYFPHPRVSAAPDQIPSRWHKQCTTGGGRLRAINCGLPGPRTRLYDLPHIPAPQTTAGESY